MKREEKTDDEIFTSQRKSQPQRQPHRKLCPHSQMARESSFKKLWALTGRTERDRRASRADVASPTLNCQHSHELSSPTGTLLPHLEHIQLTNLFCDILKGASSQERFNIHIKSIKCCFLLSLYLVLLFTLWHEVGRKPQLFSLT